MADGVATSSSPQDLIRVEGVRIQFGAVKALDGVDLAIRAGECLGLVGHNGAGKSTIVNVINGGLTPHDGAIHYGETRGGRGGSVARGFGVRCVFQELSLCSNLTVAENTRILHGAPRGLTWRRQARDLIRAQLDTIFPGHTVNCDATIEDLSIAERQMVEIAINFARSSVTPRLVILDEPTSSLDAALAGQLMAYIRRYVASGGSVILISHILGEILSTSDRVVVMKDGKVVADRPTSGFNTHTLVEAMGNVVNETIWHEKKSASTAKTVLSTPAHVKTGIAFSAREGEIIGLAGLGGHGQTEALLDLYASGSRNWLPTGGDRVAFVAGDRSLNGTFQRWSILKNLSLTALGQFSRFGFINGAAETALGADWKRRIEIRTPDMTNPILSLSGGNQQKALFARALATKASIILMDDPMRGVDIGTKQEVYEMLRSEAARGRTFVWYSTEMDEIRLCDRVYVFREGAIVAELVGDTITEQSVLAASFAGGGH